MGMQYSLTFNDAIIKPGAYEFLIGWSADEVQAEPKKAESLAVKAVEQILDSFDGYADNGIVLSGYGFYGSGSYSHFYEVIDLLRLCEPGAYLEEVDVEDRTGDKTRHILMPDRTVVAVEPTLVWPTVHEMEG